MITVAWVNFTSTDRRGPEKRFIEYMTYLTKAFQQEVRVIALFPFFTQDTSIYETFNQNGVTYYNAPNSHYGHLCSPKEPIRREAFKNFLKNTEEVKKILLANNCDVVVSNCSIVWEAAFAAQALGLRHILFIRGIFNPCDIPSSLIERSVLRYMEQKLVDISDYIVTQSEHTAKLWGVDQKENKCIIPVASQETRKWSIPETMHTPPRALILAGIESYKNQGIILDIAETLKKRGYPVVFNIYGNHVDSDYRSYMEQDIRRRGLTELIAIHEYESNIDKLYETHDIVFIPSLLETFGIVVCEAMSRYRPVISTKCGGPEETIIHEQTGYLIHEKNQEEMVTAFITLITNTEKRREMVEAARKRWEEHYDIAVIMKKWVELLQQQGALSTKVPKDLMPILREMEQSLQLTQTVLEVEATTTARKKWLVVPKSIHSPSILVGLKNTLDALEQKGVIEVKMISAEACEPYINWADCVLFSRIMDSDKKFLLDKAKQLGKRTLYYADDSLFEVPEFARSNEQYNSQQALEGLDYFIKNTECFVGCSPWLVDNYVAKYGCKGVAITPAVHIPRIQPSRYKREQVVIGFSGNVDYEFFIEKIKPLFIRLKEKYGPKIQFEFFGPKVSFLEEIEGVYFATTEYAYYEMLLARRNWDIGIAYLEESEYANKKFYNKFLEYARFGIPAIYSNTALFRRIVEPEINGLLAENTIEDWYAKIEQFINNPLLRQQVAHKAKQQVEDMFSPSHGGQDIEEQLKDFL